MYVRQCFSCSNLVLPAFCKLAASVLATRRHSPHTVSSTITPKQHGGQGDSFILVFYNVI